MNRQTIFTTTLSLAVVWALSLIRAEETNFVKKVIPTNQLASIAGVVEGSEIKVEGMVVTMRDSTKLPSRLKNRARDEMSMQELLSAFGKGWISRFSGIGRIQWFFDDGTVISVAPPPESLNKKLKVTQFREDGK
jgi:hypothetical protein